MKKFILLILGLCLIHSITRAQYDCAAPLLNNSTVAAYSCGRTYATDHDDVNLLASSYIPGASTPVCTVKVNIHIWRNDDGTGNYWQDTPAYRDTMRLVFSYLNQIYANNNSYSMNIPGAPLIPDTKVRFEIDSFYYYNNSVVANGLPLQNEYPQHKHTKYLQDNYPERLKSFDYSFVLYKYEGKGGAAGESSGYNTTNQYIRKYESGDWPHPWSLAVHMAHEFGHNFGLRHTYNSEILQIAHPEFLWDVFGTTVPSGCNAQSGYVCYHDAGWSCDYLDPNNSCTNNIMGGVSAPYHFSALQCGRIHRAIRVSALRKYAYGYSTTPLIITSNQTWDHTSKYYQNIIVNPGVTLTITCRAEFVPGAAIIVKPGGKLVLNGATLTNGNPDQLWEGIRVEGTTSQRQIAQYQGTVEVTNGSLIENARVGISTATYDYDAPNFYSLFGGIVQASNSTFKNNMSSIGFNFYANHNANGAIIDNVSYIRNCTFVVDNTNLYAYNVDAGFNSHITMWDVRGVKINGCTFQNLTGNHTGKAIYTEDAGFLIDYSCPSGGSVLLPCQECSNYTRCTFEGFATAIEAGTTGTNYALSIDHSLFESNQTGVKVTGTQNFKVVRSEFDLTARILGSSCGLSASNSSGYKIEQNKFFNTIPCTGSLCALFAPRGIIINNSGSANNTIYRNQFTVLNYGIYVTSANGTLNPTTGLEFQCNTFNQNKYDFYVVSGGSVKPWQGSPTKGADNTFTGTQTSSIYSQSSAVITYHHSAGTNRVPYNPTTSNVSVVGTAGTNNCASTICTGDGRQIPILLLSQYNTLKSNYNSLLSIAATNQYAQLLQAASTTASLSLNTGLLANALQNRAQLYATAKEMADLSSSAIHALLSDTVSRLNELKMWFDAIPYPMSKYALAEAFMQTDDYDSAEEVLDQMPDWFSFTEDKMAEHNNYLYFFNFKKELLNSGRNWAQLTEEEKTDLQSIADFSNGRASQMAQGVLCFFYHICTEVNPSEEMPVTAKRSMQSRQTVAVEGDLQIYPNPASDNILLLTGNPEITIEELFLYDVHGKCVMSLYIGQASADADISHLQSGFYMVKARLSTGETPVRKIVKK
ncbi:MAG: T9SS type A sorting domain-containing protein [Bacteroidales bacterium]|jgi:hypothetical protein|nr:T9SS type A sorting domain-containing protein [Bacteroidales bacterium]